jgi:hypothetical protein
MTTDASVSLHLAISRRPRFDFSDKDAELRSYESLGDPVKLLPLKGQAVILRAMGGLCNRLRTIVSRLDQPDLVVWWEPDVHIAHARWDECFEPLAGVTFVYDRPDHIDLETGDNALVPWWPRRLFEVRPLPSILQRIDELVAQMGRFDAMMMRRTDGVFVAEHEGNFTPDRAFEGFARSTVGPLFLATDNGETQRKVRGWVGERLVVESELGGTEKHERGDHTRHQKLPGSVVNLYVCTQAEHYLGSGGSSFSNTILMMRSMMGRGR